MLAKSVNDLHGLTSLGCVINRLGVLVGLALHLRKKKSSLLVQTKREESFTARLFPTFRCFDRWLLLRFSPISLINSIISFYSGTNYSDQSLI